MRLLFILFFLAFHSDKSLSQKKVNFVCSYYGEMVSQEIISGKLPHNFTSNEEANKAIDQIIEPTGLQKNFVVLQDPRVGNATALIFEEKRYILYNNDFMQMVQDLTKSNWAALSILAHEIGHHLQGHTSLTGGSTPKLEIEADDYSGFVLYLLGASLEDSQRAINKFVSDKGDDTHPGKFERLKAILSGWSRAAKQFPRQERTQIEPPKISTYSVDLEFKVRELSYLERIRNKGNTHQFTLFLTSTTNNLDDIESVTYHLPKSFPNANITVSNLQSNFTLPLSVYGEFKVSATVRFKDGTTKELDKELKFTGSVNTSVWPKIN